MTGKGKIITISEKELSTPVVKYKVQFPNLNKGKDGYLIKQDKSRIVLYRTNNFSEIVEPDNLLSKIANTILEQKIITFEELLINKNNYIEIDLYMNDKITNQLLFELSKIPGLKINESKLQKMKNVYKLP